MIEKLSEAQNCLYKIHSLSDLLYLKYQELVDLDIINKSNMHIGDPIIAIGDLITEKANTCLANLELIEVSMRKKEQAVLNSDTLHN